MEEKEYLALLETLKIVVEAGKGRPAGDDDCFLDLEGLALKFFFHAASALHVYRGTALRELGADFNDPGSVNVLSRAALETMLVFHYVFVEPDNEVERDYRYAAWLLSGLAWRREIPVLSDHGREVLAQDALVIESLTEKLQANDIFRSLGRKDRAKVLRGRWKLQSWTDIGRSAGLHDVNAKTLYSYLCDSAHSGSLGVLQIRQARTAEAQRALSRIAMGLVMIATAYMVDAYCGLVPQSRAALDQEPERANLVRLWIDVGSHELPELNGD